MTEAPVAFLGRNLPDRVASNPCEGCSAPCCRMQTFSVAPPNGFKALDHIRYLLGFPSTEVILNADGSWQALVWNACRFLEGAQCGVHGTPRKPQTCVFYNPYECWYKRNFHESVVTPPDLIRFDPEAFERLLATVTLDDNDALTALPSWDDLRALAAGPPAPATSRSTTSETASPSAG